MEECRGDPIGGVACAWSGLGRGALFAGHCRENCWEGGACRVKISPKYGNILVFGEISPATPVRFPQNIKIMTSAK